MMMWYKTVLKVHVSHDFDPIYNNNDELFYCSSRIKTRLLESIDEKSSVKRGLGKVGRRIRR